MAPSGGGRFGPPRSVSPKPQVPLMCVIAQTRLRGNEKLQTATHYAKATTQSVNLGIDKGSVGDIDGFLDQKKWVNK